VFERGGYGAFNGAPDDCIDVMDTGATCDCGEIAGGLGLGGPLPPRTGDARDRLTIALPGWTGTVYDLAGNVGEMMLDKFDLESGPCWARPGIYTNPVCEDPAAVDLSSRGGDFGAAAQGLLAAYRTFTAPREVGPQTGFRCGRASH
jgi:hypothetical protein